MSRLVVDASAVVEYLRDSAAGRRIANKIAAADAIVDIPHICAVEVANALRGLVRGRKMPAEEAALALSDFASLRAERHAVEPYLYRIWALRDNLTAYDAAYVVLAEALEATLVTADEKISGLVRRLIDVEVIH